MQNQLLIYTPTSSPRIQYVFDWVFGWLLGSDSYSITHSFAHFEKTSTIAKLNYSTLSTPHIPTIQPIGLLTESNLHSFQPHFKRVNHHLPAAFYTKSPSQTALPFDIFALCFYLLSRYEEYLDYTPDIHGRFVAHNSVAFLNHFLHLPLLDLWLLELKKILKKSYPALAFQSNTYQYVPSYDIDHAFAFLHKGIIRQVGALGRNIKNKSLDTLSVQLKSWFRLKKDPYQCFDYLQELDEQYQLAPIYFWLVGNYGTYDKNISPNNKKFRQLIQQNATRFSIGIHPSYASNDDALLLDEEIARLEKISNKRVLKSRQHYLKLNLPNTYQRLVQYRIKEDFTMGYAQELGFRASTTRPFYWFNLKANRQEDLLLHPFQIMDVTLKNYKKYTPSQAIAAATKIIQQTKAVDGQLMTIWHNSSLGECMGWEGWRAVYEAVIAEAKSTF